MPTDVRVPELGESIVEATVGHWLKAAGEPVAEGEPLVELETDKVNVEVSAPAAGVLERVVKSEGEIVGVGEVLAIVGSGTGQASGAPEPSREPAPTTADQGGALSAPASPAASAADALTTGADGHTMVAGAPAPEATGRATPLARRVAAERGITLSAVPGTGPAGRITQHDIAAYLAGQPTAPHVDGTKAAPADAPARPVAPARTAPARPAPQPTPRDGREERVRLSRRRLTIAQRLVEAQRTAAMLTTFNEVDMTAIMDLRRRRREAFKQRYGVGLGFMSFFTRAVISALKTHPRLNAEIQGEEMVLKRYYHIGIAVATEEGLVVPVIRDADRLSFPEIERQVDALAQKARGRSLSLDELRDGTFTITNGGVFGSLLSTPILNAPQVGILGMHKIQERPIALDGQVVIHPMMYVALSYDHRLVDGDEAVTFLVRVKELLEDPEALLLEG